MLLFELFSPPISSALLSWFGDSKVVDKQGRPLVLYHGTGASFDSFRGMVWGSVSPALANDYAEMRGQGDWSKKGGNPNVIPIYMRLKQPFDADVFVGTQGVTINEFFSAVFKQSYQPKTKWEEDMVPLLRQLRAAAKEEESGPHYDSHEFWFDPVSHFGSKGAEIVKHIFQMLGFDGIKFIENRELTYGAFDPSNVRSAISGLNEKTDHMARATSVETFDTDKIDVKEVYDPKWNIVRYTFTIPLSHGAEIEAYVVSDGDTLEFKDILTKNAKDHPLFHDNGSSSAAYSQTIRLGTAETRRLIRYIFSYVRERHPEIKNISSTRVTGARPASGKRSMDFALPIS